MYQRFFKVFFDFFLAFIALVLLSPIILLVSFLLMISNKGKVFFLQKRPGKYEKIFSIIKFKTMTDARDFNGSLLPDDRRLTKVGRYIRQFSLDEILQLINVIKGDMSLVGPRPLLVGYLSLYTLEQKKRHKVKPGITGWAQVNGRNHISWEKKFLLDVEYVERVSFLLDLKILFMTVKKVFLQEAINQDNQVGTERFKGYE
ncbi:sugar transferase [Chryseobacterium sp. T1]